MTWRPATTPPPNYGRYLVVVETPGVGREVRALKLVGWFQHRSNRYGKWVSDDGIQPRGHVILWDDLPKVPPLPELQPTLPAIPTTLEEAIRLQLEVNEDGGR